MKKSRTRNLKMQLQISAWHIKNNCWIYIFLAGVFMVLLPLCGIIFRRNLAENDYILIYGYLIYITTTCVSVFGIVPLLMYLHSTYQLKSGECIRLMPGWKETYQCRIWYLMMAGMLSELMLVFGIAYGKGIPKSDIIKDYTSLLVIVWMLYAATHLLTYFLKNVYFTFMLVELYSIIFGVLKVGMDGIWNIYALQNMDGIVWIIKVILYICLGNVCEILIGGFRCNSRKMQDC